MIKCPTDGSIVTQSERDWSIPDYTLFTPGCYLLTLMTLAVVVYRQWLVMVVLYPQVDILHPLATFHWKQGPDLPGDTTYAQCVSVNNRLYLESRPRSLHQSLFDFEPVLPVNEQLLVFTTNLDLLSALTTPTGYYALTTYNSQPVLVGGLLYSTNILSNQLWIRNERKGIWDPSLLPPMPTARRNSSAINTGSTNCIVVAGGVGKTGPVDVVEVLIQGQWSTLQPLPERCGHMPSTLHNGKWYLSNKNYSFMFRMFYCDLESLLKDYGKSSDVWSIIKYNDAASKPNRYVEGHNVVSFGQQLITLGGTFTAINIHALSPLTQSWVYVGDVPEKLFSFSAIVLPTRELLVIERSEGCRVFKASLTSKELINFYSIIFFPGRIMCCS